MSPRATFFGLAVAVSLIGWAAAAGFAGDGKVFSGVANDRGEGLIVPQTLLTGGHIGADLQFDAGSLGNVTLVTTLAGGPIDSGLASFPRNDEPNYSFQARFAGEPIKWGLRPYVGLGVSSADKDSHVFQGIARLLPYDSDAIGVHGVAGIAYELMPGVGAGVEYRFQSIERTVTDLGVPTNSQSIMLRLDLGLN